MISLDIDHNSDEIEDCESDRTEVYTPPPLEMTIDYQLEEKENTKSSDLKPIKDVSVVVLDDSDEQAAARISIPLSPSKLDRTSPNPIETYWDQWPLNNPEIDDDQLKRIYSIPDIDIPSSPRKESPSRLYLGHSDSIDHLPVPTLCSQLTTVPHERNKKPASKSKKKKKPISEYRPPSPFSPKPDYKSMEFEKLKSLGSRYGLSTNLSKGRLIKILDEIYNFTHQYETDSDFEFDIDVPAQRFDKRELNRTPPTPAALPTLKKVKKRPAVHQMSSSDEHEESLKRLSPEKQNKSDDQGSNTADSEHEGRFLELTVYELSSSSTSSNSPSITDVSPAVSLNFKKNGSDGSPVLISSQQSSSQMIQSETNGSTPNLETISEKITKKKVTKKPKMQTPTVPLKEIVRNYIKSNPNLHGRILCYEPIDFEEFHKQMKNDLNLKIASKEVMQCLDDQCITFTLRSKSRAFSSVMRAKRRQK